VRGLAHIRQTLLLGLAQGLLLALGIAFGRHQVSGESLVEAFRHEFGGGLVYGLAFGASPLAIAYAARKRVALAVLLGCLTTLVLSLVLRMQFRFSLCEMSVRSYCSDPDVNRFDTLGMLLAIAWGVLCAFLVRRLRTLD
jgi:hypothetical protein